MLVRFSQSLGLLDINAIKDKTSIALDPLQCKEGQTYDVPQRAYEILAAKYKALLEPVAVKGEAKQPELTAPKK